MELSKPKEIVNIDKVIFDLTRLDYIEVESIVDNKKKCMEYIIKKKADSKLKKLFDINWLGQILFDPKTNKYFFVSAHSNLKGVFRLDSWSKIKEVMEIINHG